MKNKKGFTLIELLAVIIILGILMIIAIPSVTQYINNSRKSAYVDTAKEIISGVRNLVNEGKMEMYDTGVTYYIPASFINTENGDAKSPYGAFDEAYIGVTFNGKSYSYYWISSDITGQGVGDVISFDELDTDSIESDLKGIDIKNTVETTGIETRKLIKVYNIQNNNWDSHNATRFVNIKPHHVDNPVCKRATTLHSFTCGGEITGECTANGITEINKTIYYGNDPETRTEGMLIPGDALDCDMNRDGTFNSETERFYYITDKGSNAVLLYYNNYGSDIVSWAERNTLLPSSSTWPDADAIRHLSNDELVSVCGTSNFNSCTYLRENAYSQASTANCWWIDSQYTLVCASRNYLSTYNVYSRTRVRPTIEVNLSKISY